MKELFKTQEFEESLIEYRRVVRDIRVKAIFKYGLRAAKWFS